MGAGFEELLLHILRDLAETGCFVLCGEAKA